MSIKVEHLSYTYPRSDEPVLRDLSFEAHEGKLTVVVGANGTGKSTLIKSILGLNKASGSVMFDGIHRGSFTTKLMFSWIGYMTQESAMLTGLNVFNVVLLGRLGTLGIKVADEDIRKVDDILRLLELEQLAERPFYALSGGQRRLVDVAQTLVKDPRILIMDEPTANLDLYNELQVLELVKAYTRQRGSTTLVTLHDLNIAARYADRVILLKDGMLFRDGSPKDVLTEEAIEAAYGVKANVIIDEGGIPVVQTVSTAEAKHYDFGGISWK